MLLLGKLFCEIILCLMHLADLFAVACPSCGGNGSVDHHAGNGKSLHDGGRFCDLFGGLHSRFRRPDNGIGEIRSIVHMVQRGGHCQRRIGTVL